MRMIDQILTQLISIHALHEESDQYRHDGDQFAGISIHALHEESDTRLAVTVTAAGRFQSTLSMRRATS